MTKKSNGITLVALTIVVIVLLMLAGITISVLNGQNGIINNSMNAKKATEFAQIKEEVLEKWYDLERSTAKEYLDNEKMAELFVEELKIEDPNATVTWQESNETFQIHYKDHDIEMTKDGEV